MPATIRTEGPVPQEDLSHVEERVRRALEPFRPRIARATLRVRRAPGEAGALVELSVPLGGGGTVRVRARGASVRSCSDAVIARAVEAISLRLRSERQELLELLLLASGRRGWAGPRRRDRRGRGPDLAA